MRVLLVEHDLFLQDMYIRMLLQGGIDVSCADSAEQAIEVLNAESVDVIVSELQLGGHDGIEILHELRSYDDWLDLPFVALSNIPEQNYPSKNRWQRYGVSKFLYKPTLNSTLLLRAVRAAVQNEAKAKG